MSENRTATLHAAGDRALRLAQPDAAERLYPHSDYLQAEWRRAVSVVRSTARGWLLDQPAQRQRGRHA
jgi:ketosteroid isomerase-like protein